MEIIGLDILTCHHMEEGEVPSSMVGSQDALLPTPIGDLVNQIIEVAIHILQHFFLGMAIGKMKLREHQLHAAVSTN